MEVAPRASGDRYASQYLKKITPSYCVIMQTYTKWNSLKDNRSMMQHHFFFGGGDPTVCIMLSRKRLPHELHQGSRAWYDLVGFVQNQISGDDNTIPGNSSQAARHLDQYHSPSFTVSSRLPYAFLSILSMARHGTAR